MQVHVRAGSFVEARLGLQVARTALLTGSSGHMYYDVCLLLRHALCKRGMSNISSYSCLNKATICSSRFM